VSNITIMASDNLIRDYKWLLNVIDSCKNRTQIDCAIKCYMLWSKKYSRIQNKHDVIFVNRLEKEAHNFLIKKANKLN
jgi:hypothetical protein